MFEYVLADGEFVQIVDGTLVKCDNQETQKDADFTLLDDFIT